MESKFISLESKISDITKIPRKNELENARKWVNEKEIKLDKRTIAVNIPKEMGIKNGRSNLLMENLN